MIITCGECKKEIASYPDEESEILLSDNTIIQAHQIYSTCDECRKLFEKEHIITPITEEEALNFKVTKISLGDNQIVKEGTVIVSSTPQDNSHINNTMDNYNKDDRLFTKMVEIISELDYENCSYPLDFPIWFEETEVIKENAKVEKTDNLKKQKVIKKINDNKQYHKVDVSKQIKMRKQKNFRR